MGYRWNGFVKPALIAGAKLLLTGFCIHHRYRIQTEFRHGQQNLAPQNCDRLKLTLSALPATAVGQILLTMAKFC